MSRRATARPQKARLTREWTGAIARVLTCIVMLLLATEVGARAADQPTALEGAFRATKPVASSPVQGVHQFDFDRNGTAVLTVVDARGNPVGLEKKGFVYRIEGETVVLERAAEKPARQLYVPLTFRRVTAEKLVNENSGEVFIRVHERRGRTSGGGS